jgi:hypothetical protein
MKLRVRFESPLFGECTGVTDFPVPTEGTVLIAEHSLLQAPVRIPVTWLRQIIEPAEPAA